MNEHEDSLTNESYFSSAECEELRKKIALPSTELIELTYHEGTPVWIKKSSCRSWRN